MGLLELWEQAGAFSRGILLTLLIMSVYSMSVAVAKLWRLRKSKKETRAFAPEFARFLQEEQLDAAIELAEAKKVSHVARVLGEVGELEADWGMRFSRPAIDVDLVRARKQKIIDTLSGGLHQLAKRRKVRWIEARGVLEDSSTLRLEGEHESIPEEGRLTFDHLILATGSLPAAPGSLARLD